MEKVIRVIDDNGLFDEIRGFLEIKGVKKEDYRLIHADNYIIYETDDGFEEEQQATDDLFIVPKEFAELIERVVYSEDHSNLQFQDKEGNTLIKSQSFHRGEWDKVTAFSFEDLNFHLEDIFE